VPIHPVHPIPPSTFELERRSILALLYPLDAVYVSALDDPANPGAAMGARCHCTRLIRARISTRLVPGLANIPTGIEALVAGHAWRGRGALNKLLHPSSLALQDLIIAIRIHTTNVLAPGALRRGVDHLRAFVKMALVTGFAGEVAEVELCEAGYAGERGGALDVVVVGVDAGEVAAFVTLGDC
jgi:hypothetical protein